MRQLKGVISNNLKWPWMT